MPTTNEQLQLADAAITHVLERIHTSPDVGYYMGVATESFELLITAYAALHGESADAVEEDFLPTCAENPRRKLQQRIEELERMTSGRHPYSHEEESCIGDIGPESLTADGFVDKVKQLLGEHHGDANRCVQAIAALLDIQDIPYPVLARRS